MTITLCSKCNTMKNIEGFNDCARCMEKKEMTTKELVEEYAGHSKVCCYNYDCEIKANREKERIIKELEAKIKQDSYYKGYEEGQNSK